MGKLKYLIIHCTDTPAGREVSKKDIEDWHIRGRGWRKVGYADMVHISGRLENLIDWNQDGEIDRFEISNGARGYNGVSRHIVYVGGGKGVDTRTAEQTKTLEEYIKFNILRNPDLRIKGHNQISTKYCPSFNVHRFCHQIGLDPKNYR